MKQAKTADIISGVLFLGLGIFVINYASDLPRAQAGLGSGGYPTFLGILLVMCALVQIALAIKAGGLRLRFAMPKDKREAAMICIFLLVIYLYVVALPIIGFLYLTPVFVFGIMMLMGYRRYIVAAAVSIGFSAGVFYLFTRVFMIFLPTGNLF